MSDISDVIQDAIEGRFEKRTKGIYAPTGGKRLVCFIDDINMPKKSQVTLVTETV